MEKTIVNTLHQVYKCDDYYFDFSNTEVTIINPVLIGMISNLEYFESFCTNGYDAVICPGILVSENGDKPSVVHFKYK
jgi:hypothetical protein